MDDSIPQRNTDDIDDNNSLFDDHYTFLGFNSQHNLTSLDFLANLMKHSLLLGAEKLLMARKLTPPLDCSSFDDNEINTSNTTKSEGKCALKQNKKVSRKYKPYAPQSTSKTQNLDTSKSMNYHPGSYNDYFPLNIISFFAVLVLKLVGFQVSLFLRFFTFPIRVFTFWLTLLTFPFQTLTPIRDHITKKLISFITNRLKPQKSMLKVAIRFSKAVLCSLYVFLVLVGLLASGFAIGGLVIKNLVEEPILATGVLNFDYTKTSPAAIVPITSSLVTGVLAKDTSEKLGRRAIPYNHKMQLTVALTLPESEYNRKLGIFQVRVESLSANGKVIVGSSYPTMLRFKSQPIHVIETLFKSVPLITGLQSEVQNLKIMVGEFTEGYEPTASFKVILEQRAEFQAGSGVPEMYDASLDIASDLPPLRRILWNWRRTIFVWIGIGSFIGEMMVVLLFCRPIVLLGGRSKAVSSDEKSRLNKYNLPSEFE
ncbi:hypothetical protein BUALT_Bualt03G0150000 [Buddleja alternifolia]|uniref:Seipin n=1 Tax=Buddleja alternifolia TaxID=168488 RepID=A0AAV6XY71_9LAMI|nr:hypothetical protein BUALT_Bualt03G0150000 [Buddleja alternifolia]